jgi:hypothetical protein
MKGEMENRLDPTTEALFRRIAEIRELARRSLKVDVGIEEKKLTRKDYSLYVAFREELKSGNPNPIMVRLQETYPDIFMQ